MPAPNWVKLPSIVRTPDARCRRGSSRPALVTLAWIVPSPERLLPGRSRNVPPEIVPELVALTSTRVKHDRAAVSVKSARCCSRSASSCSWRRTKSRQARKVDHAAGAVGRERRCLRW